MSEYVDAKKLLDMLVDKVYCEYPWQECVDMDDVRNAIKMAVDKNVVEVVRCRDCKHRNEDGLCLVHSESPDQYSTGHLHFCNDEDFCSEADAKEENDGEIC